MEEKNNIHKELQEMAPLLAKQKLKKNPFSTPENYFNTFEEQLFEQVKTNRSSNTAKATPIVRLPVLLRKIAAILVLVGGSVFLIQQIIRPSTTTTAMELSSEEIANYIADNLYEFDEELLLDQVVPEIWTEFEADLSEEELELEMEDLLEVDDLEDLL